MFLLESYLKRPDVKIESLLDLNRNKDDYFIKFDDSNMEVIMEGKTKFNCNEGIGGFELGAYDKNAYQPTDINWTRKLLIYNEN
jgi:hypothetical protein